MWAYQYLAPAPQAPEHDVSCRRGLRSYARLTIVPVTAAASGVPHRAR